MGLSVLDNTLGGILAGTWVNSILLTLEYLQAYRYFKTYPNDPKMLRITVGFLILLSTECTIGNYANAYMYCVTNWGDQAFLGGQYWPEPNYIVTTAVSAIITQSFLIWRFWRLSGSYVISAILMCIAFGALGGALALTVVIVENSAISQRSLATTTATIWFVTSAAADVAIAICLIWQFRRMRSFFDNTRSLLQRLTAATIRSGTATSTVALTAFFLFLANNQANWATGVVFCIGPTYTLTMLANLNSRRRVRGAGHTSEEETGQSSGAPPSGRENPNETFAMSGIHVIRTVQLNDDQNQKVDISDGNAEAELDSLEDRKRGPLRQDDVHAV